MTMLYQYLCYSEECYSEVELYMSPVALLPRVSLQGFRPSNQVRLKLACSAMDNTVKFLNFRTPENFPVIYPKIQT